MMTRREVFTKAMEMFPEGSEERGVMAKAIASLDKKSSKPTKAQIENEGYKAQIAEYLDDEPKTAKEIAENVGLSTAKVAALLRQMDVEKIPGEKSKDAPKYKRA
jgi:predicted Rossmann fold nucleotide-binding protein DprA/Smf involved in DNA uptake